MNFLGAIISIILFVAIIATWVNTKIIIEELDAIKKHIGIVEDKHSITDDLISENKNEEL